MPETIKAKLKVNEVREFKDTEGKKTGEYISANPVYSDDKESENYSYSQATPSGSLTLSITNPGAFGFFEDGKEYLIDITPAT